MVTRAFWLDEAYDREHGDRYAAHVAAQWWRDRGWQGWQQTFGQFVDPTEADLSRHPHLRTTLTVDAPVPLDGFPPPPEGPGPLVARDARRAVTVVARGLDALLAPVLDQLEDEGDRYSSGVTSGDA